MMVMLKKWHLTTGLMVAMLLPGILFAQDKTQEQLALQYYNNGEFEKAAEIYGELFKKTPNTYFYTYYLNALLESENYREAERVVKGLKETRELRRNFVVELGYIYQRQGEFRKAEKEFEKALEKMSPTRAAVVDLANAFMIRRQSDFAVKAYLKGRKELTEPYAFNIELANVYQSLRNFGGMMDEYLDLVETDETRVDMVKNILQQLLNNLNDEDFNQIVKGKLIERTQKLPNVMVYSDLLLWYSIQQKEFALALMQAKAAEVRTRDEGDAVFRVGQLAASNEYYDVAIEAYEHIRTKGETHFLYLSAEIMLLEVKFNRLMKIGVKDTDQILKMEQEYEKVIANLGKNSGTVMLLRNLAHLRAFYLDKTDDAILILETALQLPNVSPAVIAQCKTDLADIYLMSGDIWEATLLYSQVEKAFKYDQTGFEAKLKNARLSFYIGEFEWAGAQLDVLRTATSKLIANDAMELSLLISDNLGEDSNLVPLSMYARSELLIFRKRPELALQVLDSLEQMFPGHNIQDEVLLKKAGIMIARREYHVADSLLNLLLASYGTDILADNALIMQARMHDYHLNNRVRALELYEKIIIDLPGSIFVTEARKRYKELRGDPVSG
jgi:tetratricopeptide (TPR) repeat protein